jgi:predicted MPP superfamily phosphohydrolase
LVVGVTHAPYCHVLDGFVADGATLLLAGHTHGGQICLPNGRPIVTNCDLPQELARGLHRYPEGAEGKSWLHVSAGLGTSPYSPVRIFCRPEATLLELT